MIIAEVVAYNNNIIIIIVVIIINWQKNISQLKVIFHSNDVDFKQGFRAKYEFINSPPVRSKYRQKQFLGLKKSYIYGNRGSTETGKCELFERQLGL